MPVVHDVQQNGPEWLQLRLGRPCSSEFDKIYTRTGKRSRQVDALRNRLLVEWITGAPVESIQTAYMQIGHERENESANAYSFKTGVELHRVGFITNDAGTYGASPDRLIGDDGILELKNPSAPVHVGYLLAQDIDDDYFVQIQGQMLVTERLYVDIASYCPGFPLVTVRVERDEKYIRLLDTALAEFCERLDEAKRELMERYGVEPKRRELPEAQPDKYGFDVTDDDATAIYARTQR